MRETEKEGEMTKSYAIADFKPEMVVGSNLSPWKLVIDLNDRTELDRYLSRYDSVEIVRNGETRAFTPKEFFAALVRLAENKADEKTTTRHGKYKIRYGREVPLCEICGYGIRDERYNFCPKCGARIVED